MAESYGPFSTGAGSTVGDAQVPYYFGPFLSDGVVQGVLNSLNTFGDSSGLQVKIDTGQAALQGHFYRNDALLVKAIAAADPSLPRLDSVVVSMDLIGKTIAVTVLTGTPASTPVAPAVTQNANTWQILLATVSVPANASTIAAAQVTDMRVWADGASVSADPTQTPSTNGPARPRLWFSWLTNVIKGLKGTTNWYDLPRTTLANAAKLTGDTFTGNVNVQGALLQSTQTLAGANKEYLEFPTTDGHRYGFVQEYPGLNMGVYDYFTGIWCLRFGPNKGPMMPAGATTWVQPTDPTGNTPNAVAEGDIWIDG